MKSFNTTAICVPELHYMVDTTEKMQQIEKLIAHGDYFTINRARQYGKTTMMYSLCRRLKSEYLVLLLSFEGLGDEAFSDDEILVNQFISSVAEYLEETDQCTELLDEWSQPVDAKMKKQDAFDLLIDSLRSNIENNAQLKDLIFRILYEGESFMYNHANPVIELGEMFGIFVNKNDYVVISNKIFEIYLYNYSISVMQLEKDKTSLSRDQFIDNGKLDHQRNRLLLCRAGDKK